MDSTNAYIYGPGSTPIEQVNLSTGAVSYLVADALGSVRGILNPSGEFVASTSYSAYGLLVGSPGLSEYTPFGFADGYTDPTGLIYLLARYYDPATGQFLSVDPVVDETGDPYAYAGDDAVNEDDPTGLASGNALNPCAGVGGGWVLGAHRGSCCGEPSHGPGLLGWVVIVGTVIITIPIDHTGAGEAGDAAVIADFTGEAAAGTSADLASLVADGGGSESSLVYRGLAESENPADGLTARAPGTDVSPMSHVAGKADSPWISTTKSLEIATGKYGKFGVVGIDLSKVSGEVVDISGGFPETPGMLSNWAQADQEVLIRDYVPPEAIFWP